MKCGKTVNANSVHKIIKGSDCLICLPCFLRGLWPAGVAISEWCIAVQGYFPTEYTIDCFQAYRRALESCSREFMGELKKLNDLDLLNCDKVLKLKRRYLVRRIQVSHNKAVLI